MKIDFVHIYIYTYNNKFIFLCPFIVCMEKSCQESETREVKNQVPKVDEDTPKIEGSGYVSNWM